MRLKKICIVFGNNMKELPNVTMVAVACTQIKETIKAMKLSMEGIHFHEVLLITNEKLSLEHLGIKVIEIEKLDYKGYNHFVIYRLKDYIKTDFALLVQNDGYVLRPNKWDDVFLEYDYIGAPWAKNIHFAEDGTEVRVGNGGFSLRSQKLLKAVGELGLPYSGSDIHSSHEDIIICEYYHNRLQNHGIKFAPIDVATRFSLETRCKDSNLKPFGFHDNRKPFLIRNTRKILSKIKLLFK